MKRETIKWETALEEQPYFKQRILSVLDIRKMFPVKKGVYTEIQFNLGNNVSKEEKQRNALMLKEYLFLDDRKDKIEEKATKIYEKQVSKGKVLPYCCDFKKLEKALEIEDSENFEPFLEKTTVHKIAFVNDGLFSELILKKRLELQLSQREVAKKANLDYSLLSKLEGGARTTMTTKNALKLMNALRFTEEEKGRYLIKK